MSYLGDNTFYWCTGDNGNGQNGRIWKANYNPSSGALSGITTLVDNLVNGIRGLWVDGDNDAVYYVTESGKFKKVVISTKSVSELTLTSQGYNPRSLFISANTPQLAHLFGDGLLFGNQNKVTQYNLSTDAQSYVISTADSTKYQWVDGDFVHGILWYRKLSSVIVSVNDFGFGAETTYLDTGGTQNIFVDRINQRFYYIDQDASTVKNVNYAKLDEKNAGALGNPGNIVAFTLG